ncbi:DUF4843 domain-containing protein [Chitinophaga sp. RAB17]|uniref:DUF4843 domain-containing protein n=1 Tax=Chitinophaga sp. RAB17 TaxID=3233049 RepID=UPI003F8E9A71
MKKHLILAILGCMAIYSCKKDSILSYSVPKDNIYLDYQNGDSIVYSFAYNLTQESDTIWVPVKISGKVVHQDRSFAISVVDQATTAVRKLHFEPLQSSYVMPADSGTVHIPVIILNTDTALVNKSVYVTFRISGGTDFATQLPEGIRTKRIYFSNRLEIPAWWNFWGQLGSYSRTKHRLFLLSSGTKDLVIPNSYPDWYMEIPRALYYIANTSYFLHHPFDWVAQNPESGYVLKKRNDATGDYDFYNTGTPDIRFYLKYFKSADKYIFIDENNQQIIF